MQKVEIGTIRRPIRTMTPIEGDPTNPIGASPRTDVESAVDPANGPPIRSGVGDAPDESGAREERNRVDDGCRTTTFA
jgi:hypothetical protein